ncbi:MAG TPA: hypothetical protein VNQ76_15325 [Planctomicrobium sp.]|nr:hypothetical protein [Planctomicrobium sp.]
MSNLFETTDSMTPDERREFLLLKNFRVAVKSFASIERELWTMTEIGGRYTGEERLFYVDLVSGFWQQSGCAWELWQYGPWFIPEMPFFKRCQSAGFVIGKEKDQSAEATFQGRRFLLHGRLRTIFEPDTKQMFSFGSFSESIRGVSPLVAVSKTVQQMESFAGEVTRKQVETAVTVVSQTPAKRVQKTLFG